MVQPRRSEASMAPVKPITWSMRSSSLARTCSSRGGTGRGAVSAGDEGRDTDAAAAEHAATAADSRDFSVCSRL